MKRSLFLLPALFAAQVLFAGTIIVKNAEELKEANKSAIAGDIIVLQNGEWNNIEIKLTCKGTPTQPITFKAETAGKVIISGHSQLKIGGDYIIVDGLLFTNGYAGKEPVISFRAGKDNLANHCRVTNCAIDNFNNPKRMDENNWVLFYGKHNQLDHCSFKDKNNMGVLLAVILDDERSRENFHSIDHNYFGRRQPLGSNGGEIIRVGVSQHCEFNSNTQINDNFFEHCDGETEIISIKSGSNIVRRNLFKECQGGVVLRHGNYNTVENNVFLGNGKAGTGGVRVINKGQWVVNNFFYRCRGVDFRSPLSIMNGIPNSPAHRYVQVTDAVIANNTFYDCSPVSFCEGSDAERTLPPSNVLLINNIFYNTKDSIIYKIFDDITGIQFRGNEVNTTLRQKLVTGFLKTSVAIQTNPVTPLPFSVTKGAVQLPDSIQDQSQRRLQHFLSTKAGFIDVQLLKSIHANAITVSGAKWFAVLKPQLTAKPLTVKCGNAEEIYAQLEKKEPVIIYLTAANYVLTKPFLISKSVQFIGIPSVFVRFSTGEMLAAFVVTGNGRLSMERMDIDGSACNATHFIASDDGGSSAHYNVLVKSSRFAQFGTGTQCQNIFYAHKSIIADSIVFRNTTFHQNKANSIMMIEEKDDKGYYNAEKVVVDNNSFVENSGMILNIYRGGNDESTLGPQLSFSGNFVVDCQLKDSPLLSFTGVQVTNITNNQFSNSNPGAVLISYKDTVRARHLFEKNKLTKTGVVNGNTFLISRNNNIK